MVHISKLSPPIFAGKASPWAFSLACLACDEAVKSGSPHPFIIRHPETKKPCLIIPRIGDDGIEVTVLYWALGGAITGAFDLKDWRKCCRGYVVARYAPEFKIIDHEASIRTSLVLTYSSAPRAPSPAEMDKAFGTNLQAQIDKASARSRKTLDTLNSTASDVTQIRQRRESSSDQGMVP